MAERCVSQADHRLGQGILRGMPELQRVVEPVRNTNSQMYAFQFPSFGQSGFSDGGSPDNIFIDDTPKYGLMVLLQLNQLEIG